LAHDILLICDNGVFSDYLCRILSAAGHTPVVLSEGEDAQRVIRRRQPDLVLVAVRGEKLLDFAAGYRLHTAAGSRTLPIIAISDLPRLQAQLGGVFDFLALPLDVERLLDDIAAISARPSSSLSSLSLDDREFAEIAGYLQCSTGLYFNTHNRSTFERGLHKRMASLHIDSPMEYFAYLQRYGRAREELQKLLQLLTVGETFFFRYPSHFEVLKERLSRMKPHQPIRIWSAGCSTGEEPYSIAISIMESVPGWQHRDIRILASDINAHSLARAGEGRYSNWSLRNTPPDLAARYFDRDGESFLLKDQVKRLVKFFPMNISGPCTGEYSCELTELDAIFCRNVLIYFEQDTVTRTIRNFATRLRPGAGLFLGHSESLWQRDPELEIRRGDDCYYYLKKTPGKKASASLAPAPSPPSPAPPSPAPAPPVPEEPEQAPAARLASARELFDAHRLDEALRLLLDLPDSFPELAQALVLKGFILTARGRFEEALQTCSQAIALNDLLPEAYFLKGVALDACGRLSEAADEYRKALLLDHDFVMPRFHMGCLHLKQGRTPEAAREIRNSIRILNRHGGDGTVPYSGGLSRSVCLEQLQNALAQVA
jgi:chemotaxis protein methyltransferase CheR